MPATTLMLHPAAERALRLAAGHDSAGAETMRRILDEVVDDWDRPSDLARSGFPLELAFTSADASSLRFTIQSASLVASFDALAPRALPAEVRALAAVSTGGWLGVRVRGSHVDAKLYLQTSDRRWLALAGCAEPPVAARLAMAAYDAKSGRIELYFCPSALGVTGVHALFGDAAGDVLDLLGAAVGRPVRGRLPSDDAGFSIVAAPSRMTLYGFAGSLFGGDARCREALLRLAASRGWSFPLYAALTEPLQSARGAARHHTMFGVTAAAGEPAAIAFGVTPP